MVPLFRDDLYISYVHNLFLSFSRGQTLTCTSAPLTPVCRLVPNDAGSHIALVGEQAVAVMTLPRSRGEHGEFGGGKKTVSCR